MKKGSEETNRFKVNIPGSSPVPSPSVPNFHFTSGFSSLDIAKELYANNYKLIENICKEIGMTYEKPSKLEQETEVKELAGEIDKIEKTDKDQMLEEMQKNDHAEHVSAVVATLKTLGSSGPTAFFSKDFVSRVLIGAGRDYNKQQEEARRLEEAAKQVEFQKQADRKRKRSPSPARPKP